MPWVSASPAATRWSASTRRRSRSATSTSWARRRRAAGGTPEALRSRGATIQVGARLKPGASTEQAAAEIDAIGRALGREYPDAAGAERGLGLLASSRLPGNAGLLALFFTFLMALVT